MSHVEYPQAPAGQTVRLIPGAPLTAIDLDTIEQEAIASGALIRRYQFDPDMYAIAQRPVKLPWQSRKHLRRD